MNNLPLLDKRGAEEIYDQAIKLAAHYLPEWSAGEDDPGVTLIKLFARLMEIVIDRLNRVPDKHFLAFLDVAGITPHPPSAARAPVRFFPVEGAKTDAYVPVATQLATTPLAGEEAVIFETETALVVSLAGLIHLFSYAPVSDKYTNLAAVITANTGNQDALFSPFIGQNPIPHCFSLAQDTLFKVNHLTHWTLVFEVADPALDWQELFLKRLAWYIYKAGTKMPLSYAHTEILTQGAQRITLEFLPVEETEQTTVDGIDDYWMHAELVETTTLQDADDKYSFLSMQATARAEDILPELAFLNADPVDLTHPVYLFGEKPKRFAAFYLASREAFTRQGSTVILTVKYTPGVSQNPVSLAWEYRDGKGWQPLSVSDNTDNFTKAENQEKGSISFACPLMAKYKLNGKENYWIRVWIKSGDYGTEAKMTNENGGETLSDWTYTDESFEAPVITSLRIGYAYKEEDGQAQELTACKANNNFLYSSRVMSPGPVPFSPFSQPDDPARALYLGFYKPFANNGVSLFMAVQEAVIGEEPVVVWEYWNGSNWKHLGVKDQTGNLTASGTVTFTGPANFASRCIGGESAYWLRVRYEEKGDPVADEQQASAIHLLGVYPNTTWVKQCTTITEEILGSSTEKPGMVFYASHYPVLEGQHLEVREPERPAKDELAELINAAGEEAVTQVKTGETVSREYWVRWQEVYHFRFSHKKSRHYIMDRSTGSIIFGDGTRGMIPPAGRDNICLKSYQAGGGQRGNVKRTAINVLKRAVPFVDRVASVDAAGGGADGESMEQVKISGPQTIKNRDKAVTTEDYEWLARKASLQVARTKCIGAKGPSGNVTLILIPRSDDPQPLLSQGLIRKVKDFLDARRIPTAKLSIQKPDYVPVAVEAVICPLKMEEGDAVRSLVRQRLETYLHPLKGGPDGSGWEFGRDVYVSEISKVIEDTEGVDHAEDVCICTGQMFVEVDEDSVVVSGEHILTLKS